MTQMSPVREARSSRQAEKPQNGSEEAVKFNPLCVDEKHVGKGDAGEGWRKNGAEEPWISSSPLFFDSHLTTHALSPGFTSIEA